MYVCVHVKPTGIDTEWLVITIGPGHTHTHTQHAKNLIKRKQHIEDDPFDQEKERDTHTHTYGTVHENKD